METSSALLALCAGNSPATGEFPTQRPVTRSFDVYFELRPNIQLSKQSWGWWFETLSRPLWRHRNVMPPDTPWPSSDRATCTWSKIPWYRIDILDFSMTMGNWWCWGLQKMKFAAAFIVTIELSLRTLGTNFSTDDTHKKLFLKNRVWIHNSVNEINTHLGKTICMVATAKIFTSNYWGSLSDVCTKLHPFIIDFSLRLQFVMKRSGLC